ncbi:MAG TPA: hypothetical protein VF950_11840 [Planctomycetota bacterium]
MSPHIERLAPVTSRLAGLRASLRRLFALDGLSRIGVAAVAFILITFLADWSFALPVQVRLTLLLGGIALLVWIVVRNVVTPLGARISDDDLAVLVERSYPEINDRLISAIQLSRNPGPDASPELVDALVVDAEKITSDLDFSRVVVTRNVGKIAAWAVGLLLVITAAGFAFQDHASIYVKRLFGGATKWPQRTHLEVIDFPEGRRVVPRGEDLTIAVGYTGKRPARLPLLEYKFDSGESSRERMAVLGGERFQFTFTRVTGPFTFTVSGGDDVTAEHRVDVVTPPSLEIIRLFFEYPAYMRKPATPSDQPEPAGNLILPLHTVVRFEAVSNEDLEGATLALGVRGKEKRTPAALANSPDGRPRTFAGRFSVEEPISEYAFELKAKNGLANRDPMRFAIKGVEDRSPEITVKEPLGDEPVTNVCARPLEIEVRDDHGIARILLETRAIAQNKEKSTDWTPLEFTRTQNSRDYGETRIRSEFTFDVATLSLEPGDHVELRFRAEDYKDVGGANVRLSRVYKMSIVPMTALEKELQDAIEKIKTQLRTQKSRQEAAWSRTGRLHTSFGRGEALAPDQQGEVRQAGFEQNDVTSRLDGLRKEINYVRRRGVYNKIFDESAARQLELATDELLALTGEEGKTGLSRLAAARLDQAAKLRTGAERSTAFQEAQGWQSQTAGGIQRALEHLDKWSSYQEVIRMTREIMDQQKRVNDTIKKAGGGK